MDLISILKYALIGFIQGLTEPLPISSSAHMILFSELLNINNNNLDFEIIINFASTMAIILFFRKRIIAFFKNIFTKKKDKSYAHLNLDYLIKLIIASIPSVIIGLIFKDIIDKYFTNSMFVSIALIITSIMLFFTFIISKNKARLCDEISFFDAILIGIMQSFALSPGISRSGSIFFSGTSRNINIRKIFEFSFFLYLIVSVGALVLSIPKIPSLNIDLVTLVITFIITFITTFFSIKIFEKILSYKTVLIFAIYTLLAGIIFLLIKI